MEKMNGIFTSGTTQQIMCQQYLILPDYNDLVVFGIHHFGVGSVYYGKQMPVGDRILIKSDFKKPEKTNCTQHKYELLSFFYYCSLLLFSPSLIFPIVFSSSPTLPYLYVFIFVLCCSLFPLISNPLNLIVSLSSFFNHR